MLEKLSKRLVPYGRAHPRLKWPILGLLMLAWCLDGAWAFARAMGRELRKVGQEAAAHLRETGLTPQGIHDNAERVLDAGIRAAKSCRGCGIKADRLYCLWFLARISAVKVAAPVCYARVKTLAMRTLCGVAGFAHRTGDKLRADLPQYRRHAPQRAMAATLALVMCLGLLPVSAFAAETGCTHVHDASCYHRELICGQDEAEAHAHEDACYTDQPICGVEESAGHSHGDTCYTDVLTCTLAEHSHGDACYNEAGELICGQEEHTHGPDCYTRELTCGQDEAEGHAHTDACYTADPVCGKAEVEGHSHTDECYTETLDCKHVHDETCGGLPHEPEIPAVPECTCGAVPDAEGVTTHAEDCPLYTAPEQPPVLTEITSLEGGPEAVQTAMEGAWDVQSLPATLTGVYEGGTVEIPISWDGLPTPAAKGDYTLTAQLTLPEGYALAEGVTAPTVALILTPDPAVESVRALMEDLPTPEAVSTMTEEEREESGAYDKMDAAYNAYDALTSAQKALLPDAMDAFYALQAALGATPMPMYSVSVDTTTKELFLQGTWVVIEAGANGVGTTIYVDVNKDGVIDTNNGDELLWKSEMGYFQNLDLHNWIIHGGNLRYSVKYNTNITMNGGEVQTIYGGNDNDTLTGDTNVTITGGTVRGDVHGGGNGNGANISTDGNTNVKITGGTVKGYVFGGGGKVTGSTNVTIENARVERVVYGGGYRGIVEGDTNVTITNSSIGTLDDPSLYHVTTGIYGGGCESDATVNDTHVTITDSEVLGYVNGGGGGSRAVTTGGDVRNTFITINGSTTVSEYVYGDAVEDVVNNVGQVTGKATVTMNGGTVKGGTYCTARVSDSQIILNNGTVHLSVRANEVIMKGGEVGRDVSSKTKTEITGGMVHGDIDGGTPATGSSEIIITGGTVLGDVYGGTSLTVGGTAKVGRPYKYTSPTVPIDEGAGVIIGVKPPDFHEVSSKTGVDNFKIEPALTGDAQVAVYLPEEYERGLIATDATQGDLEKVVLAGPDRWWGRGSATLVGTEIWLKPTISLSLNYSKMSLLLKATQKITATVRPSSDPLTWSSSNDAVATVDQTGLVTAVSVGTAIITVQTGEVTATCDVTVSAQAMTGITAESYSDPDGVQYNADGYFQSFKAMTVRGTPGGSTISYSRTEEGPYTTTMPMVKNVADSGKYWYKVEKPDYADFVGYVTVNITPKAIRGSVSRDGSYTYNGKAQTPAVTFWDVPKDFVASGDYTVTTDREAINAGSYGFTVTCTGNYTGTLKSTFSIGEMALTKEMIADIPAQVYTGEALTPTPTFTLPDGLTITPDDYTVSYGSNVNVSSGGTVRITEKSGSNYYVDMTKSFAITPRPYGDGADFTIADVPEQPYIGGAVTPKPQVKFGTKTLAEGTDFDYDYDSNTAVGTATVKIKFKGNFSGEASVPFTIKSKPLPSGTTNDDVFTITAADLMNWHKADIALTTKSGWTVSTDATTWGGSVKLSTESTKDVEGNVVPSSQSLFVKNGANVYQTTVTYLLDKVMPTVTVDGMDADGVNKIWGSEKTITIHISDDLSGVRYVNIVGQDASTMVEYGPDADLGQKPLPADGVYTYTVQANDVYTITAYDIADNQPLWAGELPTFVVEKIDREKPTATFEELTGTQGADGWYTGTVTVNVDVDDPETIADDDTSLAVNESNRSGIKSWEYSLDGGTNWLTGSGSSFTIDTSGDYTDKLKLRATDNAGNGSEIATASVKLDMEAPLAPTVAATVDGAAYDGGFTAKPVTLTAVVNGTATSGMTLQYKIGDGAWVDGATVTHSENTPDAGVVYTFRALSGAGKEGAETSVTVKLRLLDKDTVLDDPDNKYESGDITIGGEGVKDGWYTEDVTVTVTKKETITDGSTSYPADTYYKLDGGEKVKLDGTTIDIKTDGVHTLEIWTEDASGNETTHLIITIKVDKTAPTITDVAGNPTDWTKDDANITFTAADATSGVKSVVVTHADGQSVTYTDSSFTADRNGEYTITVTDEAGHTTTETVTVGKIDKSTLTKPTVTGYTSDTWVKEPIAFTLTTTDTSTSGIKFQVKVGDAEWADVTSPYPVSDNTDGVAYSFRAISGAGATSETVDFTVKLDTTTPVVSLAATAGGAAYTGAATAHDVVITPSNTAANISGQTWYYQKTGDADWTALVGDALTVDFNCDTTFTFKAISGAGAESTTQSVTVKRSALSAEDLAKTEYGEGDFTVTPAADESGWHTEIPTITVTPKDKVGVGGLDATTYYELYKSPDTSGTKTELTNLWTIAPTEDGIWTLKVWTEDEAGNKTNAYEIILKVDTTDPTITDVAGNPTAWQNTDATITFKAEDATSGVKSVVVTHADGQSVTYTDGGFTADRNGGYTITVTDNAGNTTTETVTVDKIDKSTLTKPTVTGYTSDTWVKEPIAFTITTTDTSDSGIKFQVKVGDADWVDVTSPYTVSDNTDGVNYSFRTISGTGAVSETVDFTVKLDQTTPVVSLAATAGGAAYTGAATAHDVVITPSNTATNISGQTWYYQKTGDADWTALEGDALTVNFNCDTTFTFKAISGAGAESTTQSVTVKRSALTAGELAETEYGESDFTVAPAADENGWHTEIPTVAVIPKDTVGVDGLDATTYYELYKRPDTSGAKTELTDPWTIAPTEDGEWTLKIWTEDAAGNKTNAYEIILKVDTTDPTITDVAGNPAAWQNTDANITFTAADATSGVKSVVVTHADGQSVTHTNGSFTADRNGAYTITVTDEAGHTTTETVTVTYIEKTAPVISDVTLSGTEGTNGWYTDDVTVTVTATDAGGSALAADAYSFDGGTNWQSGNSQTYNTNATHTVTVWVRDTAGNITKRAAVEVKLDKETPTAPTVTATAGGEAYVSGTFTGKDVVFALSGTVTASGNVKYQVSTDAGASWSDVTGDTLTHSTNTDDAGVTYRFRAVSTAGLESAASGDTTVKRRALDDSVLTDPDNVYDPDELIPSTPTPAPDPGDTGFPYAPYWWPENPTITVPEIPYIKDPSGPVIPGTDPAINGYAATTYYKLWREGTDAEPGKAELQAPFTIKPSADGIWTLELWTEDSTGNETTHLIRKIQVDTTAPTITDVTGNATAWQKTDVTLTVNGATDATSGLADLAYSFDGGTTWQAANAKTFAANTTVTVWVRDKAGHSYKHAPIDIDKIDKTAPVVTWESATATLDANKWYGKTALTAAATDDSGESLTVTLTSGGKTYANGSTIDKNGSYTFYATAKDGAGNVGRSAALTVRIETAIDDFVAMVDGLNSDSDYQDILDAVNWYNDQTPTIKDRFSKSDDATAAYEKLMGLLRDKAEEAAKGVTDAIKNADTVEEIKQAAKDYESLPDSAKDKISDEVKKELEQKKQDADAAQKVIDQLANADRDKGTNGGKDPGGSVDEKEAAQDAYDKLTDDQKALVNKDFDAAQDKGNIDTDLGKINEVLDLLKDIKKPYTPTTKDQIKAAQDAYDALTQKQKDAFPKTDKAKLDTLEVMRQHAQNVEDKITALGENPSLADLNAAKGAYNALTADEKAMVDGTLKAELDKKYQDALDKMTADEKAAAEFAAKVEEVKNAPTVEKIEQLIKDHDALSDAAKDKLTEGTKDDYQKLVDDLNKAKPVIKDLDSIDVGKLTPQDMDKVKDVLDRYDDLTEDQKKLVDEATKGKPGILDEAVKGVEDVTDKIDKIPDHGSDSTTTTPGEETVPDLGDCGNVGNGNSDNTGSGGHTYDDHRKAIEDAKIAYEKLTDAGRKLISDAAKERLNREYAALMAYLEYSNTAKTATTNVEIAGLAEKVALPAESATAAKTVISVVMKDEKPSIMPPLPAGKSEALSVDIKLVASIYNDSGNATPTATETVQPKSGESVLVKLRLPTGYELDTLEIWHVKDSGARSRITDFWLVTENDVTYAVFELSSFSHFVFYAEKTASSGGTVTPPTPKPDIPNSDHGSTTVTPQQPRPGDKITVNPKPDEGYVVDKVIVTDQNGKDIPVKDNGDGTYSYTQPNGKVTVTVTFKPEVVHLPWNPFTDVTESNWFYESVKYVYEKGLMVGTSDSTFSPYLTTSRGMIVTILWRLEGEPTATDANPFADVTADKYYAAAIAWGAENGIVKGYGNGNFGPNDPITREQLASILYRYAQFKGMETTAKGNMAQFADQPSAWAAEAVQWAVGAGIITGKGNRILDPTGQATRAEVATMLIRMG